MFKSKNWQCACGEPWPKCETHRRHLTLKKAAVPKKQRQAKLIRTFGTNKPLPKQREERAEGDNIRAKVQRRSLNTNMPYTGDVNVSRVTGLQTSTHRNRTTPSVEQAGEDAHRTFVGVQNNSGTQICGDQLDYFVFPKCPQTQKGAKFVHATNDPPREPDVTEQVKHISESSVHHGHKRQLDTNDDFSDRPQIRSRVNLTPGTKLALRFPHLVRQANRVIPQCTDHAKRGPVHEASATSNKRRRILPFKTRGGSDSQSADTAAI